MRENEWSNIDEMRKTLNKCEEKYKKQCNQLAEKDKEIAKLRACEFIATTLDFNKLSADNCRLREQLAEKELINQNIRHQICEEIRASIKYSAIFITDNTLTQKERQLIKDQFESDKETIYDILDQIEGENNA